MLNSFTSFDLVYVMTGGGPARATELLVTYIYKLSFVQTKFDYAAAVTVFFFVLLIVVAWGRTGCPAATPAPSTRLGRCTAIRAGRSTSRSWR